MMFCNPPPGSRAQIFTLLSGNAVFPVLVALQERLAPLDVGQRTTLPMRKPPQTVIVQKSQIMGKLVSNSPLGNAMSPVFGSLGTTVSSA